MTATGHILNGLGGNGRTVGQKAALEVLGFTIAEASSMLAAGVTVGVADQLVPGPIDATAHLLADTLIEPYLDTIESGKDAVCKLDDCKTDKSIPRKERAFRLAQTAVVFALSFMASFATKVQTRRVMNRQLGVDDGAEGWVWNLSPRERRVVLSDELVHYGAIAATNVTRSGAKVADAFITGLTEALEGAGLSHKKAHELAFYIVEWELPNGLGLAAGAAAIYMAHHHPEKIGLPPLAAFSQEAHLAAAAGHAEEAAARAAARVAAPEPVLFRPSEVSLGSLLNHTLDHTRTLVREVVHGVKDAAAHLHLTL